jgi:nicotinate-nucleotide adenylyltransferase
MRHRSTFGTLRAKLPPAGPGQRIGLFGGSFNPPHGGHRLIAETARKRLGLTQVWWLVTPGNPLKDRQALAPLSKRKAEVTRLAGGPATRIVDAERHLATSYTVATLAHIVSRRPGVDFVWLMGADSWRDFHRWRDWRVIAHLMPLVIVDRPGHGLKSHAGKAARALQSRRVASHASRCLPSRRAPRWTFLSTRLSPLSSTALRRSEMNSKV